MSSLVGMLPALLRVMMKRVSILFFASLVGISNAAILFSDDFNAENGGNGTLNYSQFVNWDVTDGSVDLIGNGNNDLLPGNGLYVDLDGSSSNSGLLSTKQTFNFAQEAVYKLSFRYAGSQRGSQETFRVTLGGLIDDVTIVESNEGFQTATYFFSPQENASGKISFQNEGNDNIGAILDNVLLETVVPEPTLLAAIGMGFAAIRRSRK